MAKLSLPFASPALPVPTEGVAVVTGASSGIGFRIQEARQFMQTDVMFVNLILLGVLGAALDAAFVAASRRLVHWEVM